MFKRFWPFVFILFVWVFLFLPFFTKGLLPIPADIITGLYYPWLDYKWGYTVGVPVKNPLLSDIPSLLYPWRSFAIDQLKSFKLPLWNPYYFAGMPLLANFQSAVFSYVNIFFLFFSKPIAWSLGVICSPLLSLIAMYVFLRYKKLSQISSLFGSVVFSLSGFEVAWLEYNVHGHTALFLPLLLLVIDKIFEDKSKKWLFLLPILVAFQIFTGYIPIIIYTYLICFFYILRFHFLPQLRERKILWKRFVLLLIFWMWGLALASLQLFPGYELTVNSIRSIDPIVAASNASYLPLKNLITFIAPDFFGNPATGNYFGKAFYDNFYLFVGTGTLILIFYSLFFLKKEKNIQFWWLVFIFSLILIFKNPTGVFLEKILMLSGGVAARALFITDLSLAMLAGLGMERFLSVKEKERKKIIIPIVFLAIIFVLTVGASFKIGDPINRLVAQRNLVIPFILFVLTSFVLMGSCIIRLTGINLVKLAGTLCVFLVSVQLLYSAKKYLPFSKRELLFPITPVIEFLLKKQQEEKEPFRVEISDVVPQNFLMSYGLETISGYDALLPKQTGEFLSVLEIGKIPEKISRVHLIKNYDSSLFPLLNVKYILAKKVDEKGFFSPTGKPPSIFLSPRFKLVFEDKTVQVYEDSKFLPRAFWVYEEDSGNDKEDKKNKIEWLKNEPGKITLFTKSNKPGFIFISNNFYPGWKAFINNNEETKIYKANYSFWEIAMPEGENSLTFLYMPDSFKIGLFISLVALAFEAYILFLIIFKKLLCL